MIRMNLFKIAFIGLGFAFSWHVQAEEHQRPIIATLSEVSQCRLLTTLETLPSYNKNVDWFQYALHEILVKAENIGATHVVIERQQAVGNFNGIVSATAYLCKT